jgi:hypothetical protein
LIAAKVRERVEHLTHSEAPASRARERAP